MKNIYLIILLFIIGCSNQQDIIQSNQSENVYFSTNAGGVYVYDGTVSKISELPVNSIDSSNTAPLYASTQSFLSFIDRFDNKSNLIKTNDNIITSAVSREKRRSFIFNQFGELKIYNLRNNSTKLTSVKVYPIPKQVVFSESRQQLFFHDNKNIFKVDIHSETVDKLTQIIFQFRQLLMIPNQILFIFLRPPMDEFIASMRVPFIYMMCFTQCLQKAVILHFLHLPNNYTFQEIMEEIFKSNH